MVIASCTSYPPRISNLPVVIDSILHNSVIPDKVIINLSLQEFPNKELPKEVADYIKKHKIEVNWLEDNWKVYKKFLPILKKYPKDLILSFDDDTIYPEGIIEDLLSVHKQYPDAPISSNHYWFDGLKAHCGECSLTQAKHFEGWERYVNDDMIAKCPADDVFYTNLAALNGYFYKYTETNYPAIWEKYNEVSGYSASIHAINHKTRDELFKLFHCHVSQVFSNEDRPICVLNAIATPRGLHIKDFMVKWLQEHYNIFVVTHDGTQYEYPGLKFIQSYVAHNKITTPILYLHTKGAVMVRESARRVQQMWKYEFGSNRQKYFDLLNTAKPTIATPYAGYAQDPCGGAYKGVYPVPWYNGWMANPAALVILDIPLSEDRFIYETVIYKGIDIVGTRCNDVWYTPESMVEKEADLRNNFKAVKL